MTPTDWLSLQKDVVSDCLETMLIIQQNPCNSLLCCSAEHLPASVEEVGDILTQ